MLLLLGGFYGVKSSVFLIVTIGVKFGVKVEYIGSFGSILKHK